MKTRVRVQLERWRVRRWEGSSGQNRTSRSDGDTSYVCLLQPRHTHSARSRPQSTPSKIDLKYQSKIYSNVTPSMVAQRSTQTPIHRGPHPSSTSSATRSISYIEAPIRFMTVFHGSWRVGSLTSSYHGTCSTPGILTARRVQPISKSLCSCRPAFSVNVEFPKEKKKQLRIFATFELNRCLSRRPYIRIVRNGIYSTLQGGIVRRTVLGGADIHQPVFVGYVRRSNFTNDMMYERRAASLWVLGMLLVPSTRERGRGGLVVSTGQPFRASSTLESRSARNEARHRG